MENGEAEGLTVRGGIKLTLGIVIIFGALACAVKVISILVLLLQGDFNALPFFQKFTEIVSKNTTILWTVRDVEQKIKLPDSIVFISALSTFIFTLGVTVGLIGMLFRGGIELAGVDSKKKIKKILAELNAKP